MTTNQTNKPIHFLKTVPGRALSITKQGRLYISDKYKIFCSTDQGNTWFLDCFISPRSWRSWLAFAKLPARLLRFYIASFHVLADGSRIAVARDGLYHVDQNSRKMRRVFKIERGSRPLNLASTGSRVMFGEYGSGLENKNVHIYVSDDYGRSFSVGFTFERGDIRHVHNILVDKKSDIYWVLVGDFGKQPGIGILSKDLRNIDWLVRGSQRCRAVTATIEEECLIYGTDSDREKNFIVRLDKRSGKIETLLEVEGSSLYATQFGTLRAISTCVEPNPACPANYASLYLSRDGEQWEKSCSYPKDIFNPKYFQFGTLVLPPINQSENIGMFSGQAVSEIDNKVVIFKF